MGSGLAAATGLGLVALIVIVIVGIIIGALILMLATKLIEKFTPSFGKAVAAVVVGAVASFIVRLILFAVSSGHLLSGLIGAIVGFLVTAWAIMTMIKRPSGEAMSYGRACLIALVEWVIGILIAVVIAFFLGLVMAMALHH